MIKKNSQIYRKSKNVRTAIKNTEMVFLNLRMFWKNLGNAKHARQFTAKAVIMKAWRNFWLITWRNALS